MTLLVVGSQRVDAGKTTFSTGLIEHTGAVGFKPRAGNDYWFDHEDYQNALAAGTLFGKDANRLAATSPGSFDPWDINPVHRLWRPAPGSGTGILGQDDRAFVVDRVGQEYVRNGTVDVPEGAREQLPLSDATVVRSVAELNQLMQSSYLPLLDSISRTIQTTDRAVVESYSDIARPIQGIDPGAVAAVEPGRVRIYDGDRYVKACQITSGSEGSFTGQLEERVAPVLDLIDPVETIELPALSAAEQSDSDAVSNAYADAYDTLVEAADWHSVQV